MAYEEILRSVTFNADSSLAVLTGVAGTPGAPANPSGLQYRFVKLTGEHLVGLVTTPGTDNTVGVLQGKPQRAGDEVQVAYDGISRVECAGALAAGVPVYTDNVGRATATVGGPVLGYTVHSTANAGEVATVLLRLK